MKNAAVKLIVLDSNIDYNNVGESTGVDMHAHEVVSYEMVLSMDQNGSFLIKGKVADLGQHRVDQIEGSTKITAGDVHNRVNSASEAAVHGWILWQNPTVNGMIVRGSLKSESSHAGMQEQISMCIAIIDGECYDSARALVKRKLSDTEEVNLRSLRFAQPRYMGRYCCVNGASTSQQLLEMAKLRGLALVQSEERHSVTNQVRVEDNKHQVGSGCQMVTILDWMVPDLCSR